MKTVGRYRAGARLTPRVASHQAATANILSSSSEPVARVTPKGRPLALKPDGTLMVGMPAKVHGTCNAGSPVVEVSGASDGAVGTIKAS